MAHAGATFLGGVLVGAVAGGATAAFVAGVGAPDGAGSATDAQFELLGQTLERAVTRAVREGRRADAPAPPPRASDGPGEAGPESAVAPGERSDVSASRAELPRARADGPGRDDAAARTRDPSTPLPPKQSERLAALVVRSQEAQESRRRDWLLVGEGVVLRELGTPDYIEVREGGTERWGYSHGDGSLMVDLRGGRVVGLWGLADY